MDIIFFYLIALIPLIVAIGFWLFNKKIALAETLILVAIGFIISGAFHVISITGMTSDIQTLSGKVVYATQCSAWTEGYMKEIYKTEYYYVTETSTVNGKTVSRSVRKSREVFSHLEPRTRNHSESFSIDDTFGRNISIDKSRYLDIVKNFGKIESYPGNRTNYGHRERYNKMIGGDPNDYKTININDFVYPLTKLESFENRVKASPSVFSYVKVPENISKTLYQYPKNDNIFVSDRLVGNASFNLKEFDQMNACLGPSKKVNVIVVNFGPNVDSSLATWQEALWIGGKKNDLVICFGGGEENVSPKWSHTFGWTEKELVKRNIDTIVIEFGIKKETLEKIEKEIIQNYELKKWEKFDYLTIEIPMSYFIWCLVAQIVIVGIWIVVCINNDLDKERNVYNHF